MFNRLRTNVQLASQASNPTVTEELPGDAAGREGEDTFVRALEKKTASTCIQIFREIRVPQRHHGSKRRFELDAVLASRSCLIVAEVKNWSGEIAPADAAAADVGAWIQTRRDGSTLVHENPLALLRRKADSLAAWLSSAHGLDLPPGFLRTKLVLVNGRNLKVHPRLTASPSVYHHEAAEDACSAELSWAAGLFAWLAGDTLPRDKLRALHAALAAAPTWVGSGIVGNEEDALYLSIYFLHAHRELNNRFLLIL